MKLHLSKKELDNESGSGGLEITIDGIEGDPAEKCPGTSVFIEKYEGKIQLHVWTNNKQDCQTIILTPPSILNLAHKADCECLKCVKKNIDRTISKKTGRR